jgi:sensor histidine kinase YesM
MTLGIILIATYYKKYQRRELLSTKLEANLNRTRLQLLKMQLHPHFLFNTHNAISELIHNDPNTAERMLTTLSDLLRISLDKLEVEEVPLQQELEFVEKYIQIEQMRFQERLKFKMNIDSDTLDAIVPNMILQPLIENAVKHGITPLKKGGTVELSAYKKKNQLHIKVSDDGVGLPDGEGKFVIKGIGLSNTKARLLHLYKDKQSFEINPNNEKGFVVLLKIPFKKEEQRSQPHLELLNTKLVGNN